MPQQAFGGVDFNETFIFQSTPVFDDCFHREALAPPPSEVTVTRNGNMITIDGAADYFPMSGTVDDFGDFFVTSTTTVGGFSNIVSEMTGSLNEVLNTIDDADLAVGVEGGLPGCPLPAPIGYVVGGATATDPVTGDPREVFLILDIFGNLWHVDDFRLANPDSCLFFHWHIDGEISSWDETETMTDPDPPGCGATTTEETTPEVHVVATSVVAVCGNEKVEGTEQCDPKEAEPNPCCNKATCMFEPTTKVCNAATELCEEDGMCNGAGVCGDTSVSAEGKRCRMPAGECDKDDRCDGVSKQCEDKRFDSDELQCEKAENCHAAAFCAGGIDCPVPNKSPAGTPCEDDGNSCTRDVCDDAGGVCLHPNKDKGDRCPSDGESCTKDECDGLGVCEHPPEDKGDACGDPANRDCDDPDQCDGAGKCDKNPEPMGNPCLIDGNQCTKDECDGAGACTHPNLANGFPCGDGGVRQCSLADTCDGGGKCDKNDVPAGTACGSPLVTACSGPDICSGNGGCLGNNAPDGIACGSTAVTECDGADGCLGGVCDQNFVAAGIGCTDDGNECTKDECDGGGACQNPPEPAGTVCDDSTVCTDDDECDGGGDCEGDSVPACLIIEEGEDPTDEFTLDYKCEDGNIVSLTDVTFTRDGEVLSPSGMSFSCPGDVTIPLPITGVPNDFTAHVDINGMEGDCNIECVEPDDCEDLMAISFDINDATGLVECFKGPGSAAILSLLPLVDNGVPTPVGGQIIPIDTVSLTLVGLQTNASWLIPVIASVVAVGLFLLRRDF